MPWDEVQHILLDFLQIPMLLPWRIHKPRRITGARQRHHFPVLLNSPGLVNIQKTIGNGDL